MSAKDKTALVTGSTSGIGLACAHALAKRGINIVITGSRDESLVGSIIADIKGYNVRVDYVKADLSKVAEIEALWSEVTRLYPDGVDILINSAGFIFNNLVEDIPDSQWDLSIAVMLSAPFHLTKRCLPSMKKKGWGRIINISSTMGSIAFTHVCSYLAAKHGLHGLTKGVALENAQYGITCNAVCPARVSTPLYQSRIAHLASTKGTSFEEAEASVIATIPTGKVITPEQVAELVEFLCLSSSSSQITGATYAIDYGYTAA